MNSSRIYGAVSSLIACGLLLLILLFVKMGHDLVEEDPGLVVSFGDTDFGGGYGETFETTPAVPTAPPTATSEPSESDLVAQDDPSLVIDEQNDEEEKARAEEQKRLQQEEQERLLAEKIARERAEAERKRKEQDSIKIAQEMSNLFGAQQAEAGSGNATSEANAGNPVGEAAADGVSHSLSGRLLGRLVEPSYDSNVEGRIVVSIRVSVDGKVVSTTISESTISDPATRNAALRAAKSTRFTSGDVEVSGSITYNFRLR